MRNASIAALTVCTVLAAAPPFFAATASTSRNETQSSDPNAIEGPPTSTSAVPATPIQMGTQPGMMKMQSGATINGGTMDNGAGMTTAPKQ